MSQTLSQFFTKTSASFARNQAEVRQGSWRIAQENRWEIPSEIVELIMSSAKEVSVPIEEATLQKFVSFVGFCFFFGKKNQAFGRKYQPIFIEDCFGGSFPNFKSFLREYFSAQDSFRRSQNFLSDQPNRKLKQNDLEMTKKIGLLACGPSSCGRKTKLLAAAASFGFKAEKIDLSRFKDFNTLINIYSESVKNSDIKLNLRSQDTQNISKGKRVKVSSAGSTVSVPKTYLHSQKVYIFSNFDFFHETIYSLNPQLAEKEIFKLANFACRSQLPFVFEVSKKHRHLFERYDMYLEEFNSASFDETLSFSFLISFFEINFKSLVSQKEPAESSNVQELMENFSKSISEFVSEPSFKVNMLPADVLTLIAQKGEISLESMLSELQFAILEHTSNFSVINSSENNLNNTDTMPSYQVSHNCITEKESSRTNLSIREHSECKTLEDLEAFLSYEEKTISEKYFSNLKSTRKKIKSEVEKELGVSKANAHLMYFLKGLSQEDCSPDLYKQRRSKFQKNKCVKIGEETESNKAIEALLQGQCDQLLKLLRSVYYFE